MASTFFKPRVLPGFPLTLGLTVAYISLVALVPFVALVMKASGLSWADFWTAVASRRSLAAFKLTFSAALVAAGINLVFGVLLAWVLARYRFPGKPLIDGLIDLPFALPTAVAGISLAALYAPEGWIGQFLAPFGIQVAFTQLGVIVALVFIGLPFVVRTVQPVIQDMDPELEQAAASLGASRWQTFRRVIVPTITPAAVTGFALATARGIGEYGSVIFIAGNIPFVSEIVPLLIIIKLEQFDYAGAAAVGTAMLFVSFVLLLVINALQSWGKSVKV